MALIADAVVFLLAAVIAVPVFKKLGMGAVLGYLAAGVVLGPSVLSLAGDVDTIFSFAKLGVVLLLFLVGLELAPARLWALRRSIFGLGTLQVVACALPIGAAAYVAGLSVPGVVVVALGLAFSSTAFALQALSERGELSAAHGRAAFAILLFKYLALLPLMAAIPLMGEGAAVAPTELLLGIARTVGVLVAVVVGGHFLLRPVFRAVAAFGETETFTATALAVVLGTAFLVDVAGLPMPIGAFLAGVLLADSEYRQEIHASIEPFKGLLLGLFFMAVGMSADLRLLGDSGGLILGLTAGLVALKLLITYAVGRHWGLARLGALRLSAVLPQGGELAFVLFSLAVSYGVLARPAVDILIAVVTLSMAATPLIMKLSERFLAPRLQTGEGSRGEAAAADAAAPAEAPDVIIAGFGRYGQMIGRFLNSAHIRFTALEANVTQVDFVRRFGHRIYFGNAAKPEVLRAAQTGQAKAVVVAVNNVAASLAIVDALRNQYPNMPIYALARTRKHAWQLQARHVRCLVREVATASMELGEQLLEGFGWAREDAQDAVAHFRAHDDRVMAEQYALYSRYRNLSPAPEEVAHELENLFESDLQEPIEAEASLPESPKPRGWRRFLPAWPVFRQKTSG